MGKYTLEETVVPDGIVRDETIYDVEFTQEDDEAQHKNYVVTFSDDMSKAGDWGEGVSEDTKIQTGNGTIINKPTKLEVSKKAVTGDDELEGATLTIKDSKGNVVIDKDGNELTWVSGKKEHKVEGLHIGETYQLEEAIQADGYVKATTIPFTVNADGSVTSVTMIDKVYTASKVDVAGEEIEGAEMTVTDENGEIVDQWTSDGSEHKIKNLEEGKTYTIHEVVAPGDYVKATDITFTVEGADENGVKKDEHVDVIDKLFSVSKVDMGGSEVKGAEMTVTNENGEVVDQWTSDGTEHNVKGLEAGKTYKLREDTAPLGYVKRTEVTFTVLDDGLDQTFNLVDTVERASKTDTDGNNVTGAKMQAIDSEGNVVDTWTTGQHIVDISDENKAAIKALGNGKSVEWTLEDGTKVEVVAIITSNEATKTDDEVDADFSVDEEPAVKNDETDEIDSDFLVDSEEETTDEAVALDETSEEKAVSEDSASEIRKYNVIFTDTEGVVSTYDIDEDGNETTHMIQNLVEGETYTVEEVEAPKGFYYAQKQTIVAGEDESDHEHNFVDRSVKYLIEKVDENGAPVKGVTLKLTDVTVDADGKLVNTDENGQPAEIELPNGGVTTGEPFELDGVLEAEHNYRLEETEWTNGVYKATDVYFNVDKYGDPSNPVITITMIDSLAKVTVNKIDASGNPLAGAKMQIIEAELATDKSATTSDEATKDESKIDDDAYLADEETAEAENHDDEIMTLEETSEEKAVVDSEEVTDTEATKQDATDSIDEEYTISDSELKYVPVKDEDGSDKVVYEFTTTDDASGVDISDYVKGDKTYILREVETPYGYNTIKDEYFTVTGRSDSFQVIYAIDTPKQYGVEIKKTNESGSKTLEGAEFGLFSTKTGKLVRDVDGNVCQGKTDSNGKLTFNVSYNGTKEGYYIMEIAAPTGYEVDKTHHVVKLADDYTFVDAMKYTITNKEKGTPAGVSAPMIAIVGGCVVLVGIAYLVLSKKKKSEDESKENK